MSVSETKWKEKMFLLGNLQDLVLPMKFQCKFVEFLKKFS
jgi:hypothetical protein